LSFDSPIETTRRALSRSGVPTVGSNKMIFRDPFQCLRSPSRILLGAAEETAFVGLPLFTITAGGGFLWFVVGR
jgi:hypothetical protein